MRSAIMIMSVILLLQGSMTNAQRNYFNDLITLHDATTNQGFQLESWEVIFIDTIDQSTFQEIQRSLQHDHLMKKDLKEDIKRYIFRPKSQADQFNYQIILLDSSDFLSQKRLQIKFKGTDWNRDLVTKYISLTNKLQRIYNLDLKKSFSCIKIQNSDIMNVGFSVNNMLTEMQLLHRQDQSDSVAESSYMKNIYGYSPLLSNVLEINEEKDKINLQLTIRKMTNDKKQIIIGTPVILDEY